LIAVAFQFSFYSIWESISSLKSEDQKKTTMRQNSFNEICSQARKEEPGINPLRTCVGEFENCIVLSKVFEGGDDEGEVDGGEDEF
jgi:hypothetical protein